MSVDVPLVSCIYESDGCKEKVKVTESKAHYNVCLFRPSKICPRLHETPQGLVIFHKCILPAMEQVAMSSGLELSPKEKWFPRSLRNDNNEMPALIDDEDGDADRFWRIVSGLPLACPEVLYPGIFEILAEGYAHELEESTISDISKAWDDVKNGLRLAQKTYHTARSRCVLREESVAAASLHAKLLGKPPGDVPSNALVDLPMLPSVQPAVHQAWLYLDLSRTWCFALEALALNPPEGMTAVEAVACWREELGEKTVADIIEIFQKCKVPKQTRLIPLWPEPLPTNFIENCRLRLGKLRKHYGVEGSRRRFRLMCQSTAWMSRSQVDRLLAELEGREFALPEQPQPKYWTDREALLGFSFQLVHLDSDVVDQFQAVFDKSYRSFTTKDRKTVLADRFLVEGVVRIENGKAWSEYALRRDAITKERWCAGAVPEIEGVKVDRTLFPGQVVNADASSHAEFFVETLAGAQELFLFHGTSSQGALNIAQNDFSTEFSNAHGLYGAGLYFAESVSKSDEYCEEQNGLCTLLVCRVCMGNPLVVETPKGSIDALIKHLDQSDKHSILGDREKARGTYREFIVYDSSAAYAEYIVTFRRSFGEDAKSSRCASAEQVGDSSAALQTALASARKQHSERFAGERLTDCDPASLPGCVSLIESRWSYVGGEWAEGLTLGFVQDVLDTADVLREQKTTQVQQLQEGGSVVCEACGKSFADSDGLLRHLDAYAKNDASGDHARARAALRSPSVVVPSDKESTACCTIM